MEGKTISNIARNNNQERKLIDELTQRTWLYKITRKRSPLASSQKNLPSRLNIFQKIPLVYPQNVINRVTQDCHLNKTSKTNQILTIWQKIITNKYEIMKGSYLLIHLRRTPPRDLLARHADPTPHPPADRELTWDTIYLYQEMASSQKS